MRILVIGAGALAGITADVFFAPDGMLRFSCVLDRPSSLPATDCKSSALKAVSESRSDCRGRWYSGIVQPHPAGNESLFAGFCNGRSRAAVGADTADIADSEWTGPHRPTDRRIWAATRPGRHWSDQRDARCRRTSALFSYPSRPGLWRDYGRYIGPRECDCSCPLLRRVRCDGERGHPSGYVGKVRPAWGWGGASTA